MKKTSKILALVLVVAMVVAMGAVTAFAAGDGSITVDNATVGETYKIYKVFDLTYATAETSSGTEGGDALKDGVSYTYTKTGTDDAFYAALTASGSPFDLAATSTANVYQVTKKAAADAETIAAWLKTNEALLTEVTPAAADLTGIGTDKVATATTVKWKNLDYGYYYITSSVGATVTIDSTLKDVIVKDKNSIPTQDKTQAVGTTAPTSADGYADAEQQVQVGDHVWYQIEVKDGKGSNLDIVITDTMSNGLSFDNNITVFKSAYDSEANTYGAETSVATSATTWYQTDPDTGETFTFKVTFDDSYVSTLNEKDKVFIRFSATVTTEAATDTDANKENNTSVLTYSNQSSTDSVDVVTYKFQLDKVKDSDANYEDLLGARFELYRGSVADANKIWFTLGTAESGVPVLTVVGMGSSAPVAGAFSDIRLTDNTVDTDTNSLNSSKVIFKGLDKDTYVLHETEAPQGYNIADDETVADTTLVAINGTITDTAAAIGTDDTGVVSVVNNSGQELPSTGGIGTTIFYVVGAILVVGAVVILVTRRRMGAAK